jgi:hypothetical protein
VTSLPRTPIAVLCLGLATLAVYAAVLDHGFVSFDDDVYLLESPVREGLSADGLRWAFSTQSFGYGANWHPLTWLSHMLDVELFGLERPGAHHATSLLLHVANAVLLLLVLQRMTGAFWRPAVVAGLFALHPLHVESVAWAAERKDVLSTLFWFGSIGAWLTYAQRGSRAGYALCFGLLALGLLSKSMLVTAPFVLLLLDYWPLRRLAPPDAPPEARPGRAERTRRRAKAARRREPEVPAAPAGPVTSLGFASLRAGLRPACPGTRSLVLEKLPLFALVALASGLTYAAQRGGGSMAPVPLGLRFENALVACVRYLGKTFWPTDLAVLYPYQDWSSGVVFGAALLLALVTGAVLLLRSERYLAVGWLWFLGTLVPVLGLVQIGVQSMADRYTYVPLVGLLIAVVWGAEALCRRLGGRLESRPPRSEPQASGVHGPGFGRALGGAAAVTSLAACLWLTPRQVATWKDSETLYRHALAVTEDNYVVHVNLGLELGRAGQLDEAIEHYREALRIHPRFAAAHTNLGQALVSQGRMQEAIAHFEEALRLDPDDAKARENLGLARAMGGEKGAQQDLLRRFLEGATRRSLTEPE